ncbi:hypothetical protein NEOLEDRAFT_1069191, partial [Neolentinus lepideus HHB14362 ss-1]
EEVILRVQGILCIKDLPPQLDPIYIKQNQNYRKAFLRQSIRLTGFSDKMFQRNVDGIQYISRHLSRLFKEGSVTEWQPSDFDGHQALDISNRYFMTRKHNSTDLDVPFAATVDPHGFLEKLTDNQWTHTDDNKVTYHQMIQERDQFKYITADPAIFRLGDIVEAEISIFVLSQGQGPNQHRVTLVLRSLTLLDAKYSDPITVTKVKRRTGHEDQEVQDTRRELSKMRLEGDAQDRMMTE